MKTRSYLLSLTIILTIIFSPLVELSSPVYAAPLAAPTCLSSGPLSGAYTVNVCISSPAANANLTGNATVTATATVTGTNPGVQRMVFYLTGGVYLLTDYQSPYTFTLPTNKWVDGIYALSVSALMRDGFTSQQTLIGVNFSNGITTTPTNTNTFQASSGRPANGSPFVVVAVGDGASGEANAVNVTNLMSSIDPNMVLYLGDVYEKGSIAEFYNWYGGQNYNFGKFKSITNPAIGNHEYSSSSTAAGYFNYWDNVPNYYSYNANGWHFISLNSNYIRIGVNSTSPQYQWLQQDLAANSDSCTIVYFHHPLFNIGPEGSTSQMGPIWSLLAQNSVEIVLNGHDHTYQRWVPLDGSGQPSSVGITEFIAGASGHGMQTISNSDSRVAYSTDLNPTGFGALALTLNPSGATYKYINTAGTILDSGTVPCLHAGPDTEAPSIPTGLSVQTVSHSEVDLSWSASTDNVGVTGYRIYRNGSLLTSVNGASLTYSDMAAAPATTYSYSVDAFDQVGNHSSSTTPVNATTAAMPASITFSPVADSYVSASSQTTNYGSATTIRLDGSPDLHGYIRFLVQGSSGAPITRATLKLFTNTTSSVGIQAMAVTDTTWGEKTIKYTNRPSLGNLLASSGAMSSNTWVSMDVTPYLTGDGLFSFGIQTLSSSAMSMQSREAISNQPQLILEFGITPPPDTQAPSVPENVTPVVAGATQIDLTWSPSTDNVGVTGYDVFRNSVLISTLPSNVLTFQDINLTPETSYTYTLDAFDQAGNHSSTSTPVSATTAAMPTSIIFNPVADSYVSATNPTSNYGSSTNIRFDGSPDLHGYIRFLIQGTNGSSISRATLKLFTNTTSSIGIQTLAVADTTWGENTINYNNQPVLGSLLASSGAISSNSWISMDVTPYLTGDGLFSFGLRTLSSSAISMQSREATSNKPQLIVEFGNLPPIDNQAPSVPGNVNASVAGTTEIDLTWSASTDNVGVTGYGVFRNSVLINTVPATSLAFQDLNLSPATTYIYSLDAFDQAGNHSTLSSPISATTNPLPDNQAPTIPGGLSAFAQATPQVDLTWSASSDNVGVTGYSILRDGVNISTVSGSILSYSDTSVEPSTTYSYSVDAFDLAGNHSVASNSVPVTTNPLPVDSDAPSVPAGLTGYSPSPVIVDLSWSTSSDNVGIAGYTVFRDGGNVATVSGSTISFSDSSVSPATTYVYTVDAFDQAGNHSAPSSPVSVTTQSLPSNLTLSASADTYVNASNPTTNYGSATTLRVDASPDLHSYVRFNVQGVNGRTITRASLIIHINNGSSQGIQATSVADSSWGESSTTFATAPPLGSILASSGSISAGSWIVLDVTGYVTGNGLVSFGVLTPSSTANSFPSREAASNGPELLLEF